MRMTGELSTTTVLRICRHFENLRFYILGCLQFSSRSYLSIGSHNRADIVKGKYASFEDEKRFCKIFDEFMKIRIHTFRISKN